MMRPPLAIWICLYGCLNCFLPAAITASSAGFSFSISAGLEPEMGRLRFFSSIFRSLTFMASSLCRSEVALLTSAGVRLDSRVGVASRGVADRGVPGMLQVSLVIIPVIFTATVCGYLEVGEVTMLEAQLELAPER